MIDIDEALRADAARWNAHRPALALEQVVSAATITRRTWARTSAPILAAAAVVCVAAAGLLLHGTHPSGSPASTPASSARAYVERLLARVPLPDDARRVDRSPVTFWYNGTVGQALPNQARLTAYWQTSRTGSQIEAAMTASLPASWALVGEYESSGDPTQERMLVITITDRSSGYFAGATVTLATVNGVSTIRAELAASPIPTRNPRDVLALNNSSASVTLHASSKIITRTLNARDANHIAAEINKLPAATPYGWHGHCAPTLNTIDVLYRAHGQQQVRIFSGGCTRGGIAVVESDGTASTILANGSQVEADIIRLLKLPTNWWTN